MLETDRDSLSVCVCVCVCVSDWTGRLIVCDMGQEGMGGK